MNIIKREIKTNLKPLLIWSGAMIFLIYAGMVKYSAFAQTGEAVNDFVDSIPDIMKSIFGIEADMDLTSVTVFYSIFFTYFLLLATVHSGMLGALIVSKEERDKTSEFLFVKPITRRKIVSYKIIAALFNLLVFDMVTFITSLLCIQLYQPASSVIGSIFLVIAALFAIQLVFLGLGLLLGGISKNSKKATSLISFIIMGTFLLKIIISLDEDLKSFSFLTPFVYFDSGEIMFHNKIDLPYLFLAIGLILFCIISSYYFYQKRDLLD